MSMLLHEVKTPLTAIRFAVLSLLRVNQKDGLGTDARLLEDQKERLDSIQSSVDSIDRVMNRTREADQLEQGALQFHRTTENIANLIRQSTQPLLRVTLQGPDVLQARVDAVLLAHMLKNLLDNAYTYSPEGSPIGVTWRLVPQAAAPTHFAVTVSNAVGVAGAPDPAKVFSKYYRAEAAQRFTGTGLGLYWVRGVCQALGGQVSYRLEENEQGEGGARVVFEIQLPC